MSSTLKIFCRNINRYIDIAGGETLLEIAQQIAPELGQLSPICALVNNKNEPLQYQLFGPKQVEFLDRTSPSGSRVYVRSLCMMLYCAVKSVYPGWRLTIEHSLIDGYFCRLSRKNSDGSIEPFPRENLPELTQNLSAEMRRLQQADIPFERKERLTSDVIEKFRHEGLNDKAQLLDTLHEIYTTYYRCDGTIDSYYGALAPSTAYLTDFELEPFHRGFLLKGWQRLSVTNKNYDLSREAMYHAFLDYLHFNEIIGVSNVGELNEAVLRNHTAELINVSEALHDKKIAAIADEITARFNEGGARIVLIAGPSSSGKTTTSKRLGIYLMTNLLKPKTISMDNYFVNRVDTPRDEFGEYDFESINAVDLDLFNSDIDALLRGEEVNIPFYNFEKGIRQYKGNKMKLDDRSVLVIEGIHGLNPELTKRIDEKLKYRVYVSAFTTLSLDDHNWIPTTDNRLLRRIVRDYKYRGFSAQDTIRMWPSVRRGEEKWIFPYQGYADSTFNSSLLFELGVMKDYADQILRTVPNDCPEYTDAYRLRRFLSYFTPIGEKSIPPTSLLREFLGGSSFHY